MATVKYELSTKIERNGKERWHKIGVVLENDKGPYAIIDNIPVGFTGLVSFFTPRKEDPVPVQRQTQPSSIDDLTNDLDIPF